MTRHNMSRIVLAAVAALGAALPTQAAIVAYDFQVNIVSGPLTLQNFSGAFSYDDAQVPSSVFGDLAYTLSSFSFEFDGTTYAEADFNPLSPLTWTVPAGAEAGLDGAMANIAFTPGTDAAAPSFAFVRDGLQGFGDVTYTRADAGEVPEPASAALVLGALLALGAARRRG